MIYLNQGQNNQAAAVCSRNKTLPGSVTYLWSMTHKLSGDRFRFIPFRVPPSISGYEPAYDLFCIQVSGGTQVLTGATVCGQTNVDLIPGLYDLKCYEQYSTSNLNPMLSHDVVYENMVTVVGVNQNIPTTYSGTTDTYIIYDPNNTVA